MDDSTGIVLVIINLAFIIFMIAAMWKLFESANEPGSSQNDNIILIIG